MQELKDSFWKDYLADIPGPSDAVPAYARHAAEGRAFFTGIPAAKAPFRYAPGKWSVQDLAGHITDAHLVFLYRILRITRGDTQPLSGFDESAYVRAAAAHATPWEAVLEGYLGVSHAIAAVIGRIPPGDWERMGNANGVSLSALDMLRVLIGHERHHVRMLKERYGLA